MTDQGDMALPTIGHGAEAIERDVRTCAKWKIRACLQVIQGEWFLDTTFGFPWREVARKNPNLVAIRHQLGKFIAAIPPVVQVTDLALVYNRQLRDIAYVASARLADGSTVSLP